MKKRILFPLLALAALLAFFFAACSNDKIEPFNFDEYTASTVEIDNIISEWIKKCSVDEPPSECTGGPPPPPETPSSDSNPGDQSSDSNSGDQSSDSNSGSPSSDSNPGQSNSSSSNAINPPQGNSSSSSAATPTPSSSSRASSSSTTTPTPSSSSTATPTPSSSSTGSSGGGGCDISFNVVGDGSYSGSGTEVCHIQNKNATFTITIPTGCDVSCSAKDNGGNKKDCKSGNTIDYDGQVRSFSFVVTNCNSCNKTYDFTVDQNKQNCP